MLRAFQGVCRPARKLQRPLCLLQLRGRSDKAEKEKGIVVRPDRIDELMIHMPHKEEFVSKIPEHQQGLGIFHKLAMIRGTSCHLWYGRAVMGKGLANTNLAYLATAFKDATEANEIHKNEFIALLNAFKKVHRAICELRNLKQEMAGDIQKATWPLHYLPKNRKRVEKYQTEIRDLLRLLELPRKVLPSDKTFEAASKKAAELFQTAVEASLPRSLSRMLKEANEPLRAAMDEYDDKVKIKQEMTANKVDAQAQMEVLEMKEANLHQAESTADWKLRQKENQLEAAEEDHSKSYFWKDHKEKEKIEKKQQVAECREDQQKIQNSLNSLLDQKAKVKVLVERAKDELETAKKAVTEAEKKLDRCKAKSEEAQKKIAEECKSLGALDLQEAEQVKFLSAYFQSTVERGRRLAQMTCDDGSLEEVRVKKDTLQEQVLKAQTLPELLEALESFLKAFPKEDEFLTHNDDMLKAYMKILPKLNVGSVSFWMSPSLEVALGEVSQTVQSTCSLEDTSSKETK